MQLSPVLIVRLQDLNKRQGLALLTKVGESVKHVAGGYKLRARPPEFCAMGEYLDTFSQKLGTIDRIAQRILKEQSGIAQRLMTLLFLSLNDGIFYFGAFFTFIGKLLAKTQI